MGQYGKDPGGLTRLEITKSEKGWTVHSWGTAGQGLENDLGEVALHLLVESSRGKEWKHGIATSDAKFKDSYLMLRFEKGELIAEDFNVFKDNSGRPNYRAVYKFKKVNDNLNPR